MHEQNHIPVFDGHNDMLLRLYNMRKENVESLFLDGSPTGHIDLPRARQGGLAGGLFAIFPPPVEKFELDTIYDEIIHDNAVNIIRRFPALTTEVAVMGDFIEHLTKSEGRDLIEYLQYRCRHIFLVIPVDWVSFDWEGRPAESHVAIWRPVDFNAFEGAYAIERKHLDENGEHRFVLAVVNGIRVPLDDHFVVVDDPDETRPFGYLNAPHQERPKWQLPDGY